MKPVRCWVGAMPTQEKKLIATKKQLSFKEKISESIGKPKKQWESLKYLDMSSKTLISNFNVMEGNDTLTCDTRSISTVFKNFFANLPESLLTKLPNLPDKLFNFNNYR